MFCNLVFYFSINAIKLRFGVRIRGVPAPSETVGVSSVSVKRKGLGLVSIFGIKEISKVGSSALTMIDLVGLGTD